MVYISCRDVCWVASVIGRLFGGKCKYKLGGKNWLVRGFKLNMCYIVFFFSDLSMICFLMSCLGSL